MVVSAVMCREGFLSGAAALDLRPSLWFGRCQGNVCEQEGVVHISGGAVSAGSAMWLPSSPHCDSLPNSILSLLSPSHGMPLSSLADNFWMSGEQAILDVIGLAFALEAFLATCRCLRLVRSWSVRPWKRLLPRDWGWWQLGIELVHLKR